VFSAETSASGDILLRADGRLSFLFASFRSFSKMRYMLSKDFKNQFCFIVEFAMEVFDWIVVDSAVINANIVVGCILVLLE